MAILFHLCLLRKKLLELKKIEAHISIEQVKHMQNVRFSFSFVSLWSENSFQVKHRRTIGLAYI